MLLTISSEASPESIKIEAIYYITNNSQASLENIKMEAILLTIV